MSPYLVSRVETGDILRQGQAPVTEVRAGLIIGPGSAAPGFEVQPLTSSTTRIVVAASLHPTGIKGMACWHALTPAHALIFPGLVRQIAARAEAG